MNLVGSEINGYRFEEALGSGSFGSVYKVSKEGQLYAAKVLAETYILDEFKNDQNRITREIDVLKKVKGDNLIKFQEDFFFENEFGIKEYVIVMEYFSGKTLRKYLKDDVELDVLISIFVKVLNGVKQLHNTIIDTEGIIHRDLKPDNILIKKTPAGYSGKLIDFDDSYFSGNPPEDRECVVGTPEYYSPEQALYIMDEDEEISGAVLTCKSDIFTLGIIMTEYFTGDKPLVSKGSVWSAINKGETVAFSKVVDPRVRELLLEMLSQKPENRPDIKEVFERLRSLDKEPPIITGGGAKGGGLRGKGLAGAGKDTTKVTIKPPTIEPPVSPPSHPTTGGLRGKGLDIAKKK